MAFVFGVIGIWSGAILILAWSFRLEIVSLWHEPVLKKPILIIESDDWGPGPESDAGALRQLIALLTRFRDRAGRHPVMTIGALLAIPDRERIAAQAFTAYSRLTLDSPRFQPVRAALAQGVERGVFALQLHGMEHYWPRALMSAARADAGIRSWVEAGSGHEELPAHLQSRWVDATTLPSRPLPRSDLEAAAAEEVRAFEKCFGRSPRVGVPPTFVWTEELERAWLARGVEVIVTPGRRYACRNKQGQPACGSPPILNATRSKAGALYVVRDLYFEPYLGHKAANALGAVQAKAKLGRPALLETHRANFVGDRAPSALAEMTELLRSVRLQLPDVGFLCTWELAQYLSARDPQWTERSLAGRIHVYLRRLYEVPRLRRFAWLTGLILPGWLALKATAATPH